MSEITLLNTDVGDDGQVVDDDDDDDDDDVGDDDVGDGDGDADADADYACSGLRCLFGPHSCSCPWIRLLYVLGPGGYECWIQLEYRMCHLPDSFGGVSGVPVGV